MARLLAVPLTHPRHHHGRTVNVARHCRGMAITAGCHHFCMAIFDIAGVPLSGWSAFTLNLAIVTYVPPYLLCRNVVCAPMTSLLWFYFHSEMLP